MEETREPEVWKPIPDYEGIYEVSSWGNVRSFNKIGKSCPGRSRVFYGRLLSLKSYGDYFFVVLCKDDKKKRTAVHLIVLSVFHRYKNENEKFAY